MTAKTALRNEKIKAQYATGRDVMWLASEYELQPVTIATILGIPSSQYLTPVQNRNKKRYAHACYLRKRNEARALHKAGASIEELAARFDVQPRTIAAWLGVSLLPYVSDQQREQYKRKAQETAEAWRKELRGAYKMGIGVRKIAEEYGLAPVTVASLLNLSTRRYLSKEQLEKRRAKVAARQRAKRAAKKAAQSSEGRNPS